MIVWPFLLIVACWPAQGLEVRTQGTQGDNPRGWARVTVERGRLSVDLKQADIQTVLAQIGEQAGIAIIGPKDQKTISVHFTGVELEKGLRRLLRLASLNHIILYTAGPAGAVTIKEVRVFGEEKGGASLQPTVAKRDAEERIVAEQEAKESAEDAVQRFTAALTQALGAPPSPAGEEESEAARRFRELLEQARQGTSPASEGTESEAVRRFREALQLK